MITSDYYLYGFLAMFIVAIGISFWRLQRNQDNDFNLFDIIMEGGRVSRIAIAFMTTLVITSWIMIKLTIDQKMTEGFMMGYGAMWVAPIIAKLFSTNTTSFSQVSSTTLKVEEK